MPVTLPATEFSINAEAPHACPAWDGDEENHLRQPHAPPALPPLQVTRHIIIITNTRFSTGGHCLDNTVA